MTHSNPIDLAQALIRKSSVTPQDKGCQDLVCEGLLKFGCEMQKLRFDDVDNVWLTHGKGKPLFVFAGHTDVVPPGPEDQWDHPPFSAQIKDGILFGRGAADMKGSVAAMACAMQGFITANPNHVGTIALLLTSDEEGPALNGTKRVIEHLTKRNIQIDYCIVGEPSSHSQLGDVIKVGRRGSLSGELTIHGKQGHIAYPHLAKNPIHAMGKVIGELNQIPWDKGNDFFPPSSFQFSNARAGDGTGNVIPGSAHLSFNFRFSTELNPVLIKQRTHALLDQCQINYALAWTLFGQPFVNQQGELIEVAKKAIHQFTGLEPQLSTSGGTSDGRFIAPTGAQVIELGPINASIHKVNEQVKVADLVKLTSIFKQIAQSLL